MTEHKAPVDVWFHWAPDGSSKDSKYSKISMWDGKTRSKDLHGYIVPAAAGLPPGPRRPTTCAYKIYASAQAMTAMELCGLPVIVADDATYDVDPDSKEGQALTAWCEAHAVYRLTHDIDFVLPKTCLHCAGTGRVAAKE